MSLKDNYKVFRLQSGEIIITQVETDDEGMYVLKYPAIIVPIPPERSGGAQNQIGFGMFMPFSDYSNDIRLNPNLILVDSDPHTQIKEAYMQWTMQIRSRESGIIVPQSPSINSKDIPREGRARSFNKLNV